MKLGKDAMWRQLDMPLADALEYLRAQLTIELSTEDAIEGVTAFFEKREPELERTLMDNEAAKVAEAAAEANLAEAPDEVPAEAALAQSSHDLEARRAKVREIGGGEERARSSTRAAR